MVHRIILLFLVAIAFSCSDDNGKSEGKFYVVTTTSMIRDAVINIGDTLVKTDALMGPGIDPHLYKATHGDLEKLREADLVLYNGLNLEGKMGDIMKKLERTNPVVAVAETIPADKLLTLPEYNNAHDPHIWFDVDLWKTAVENTGEAMMRFDTANAAIYRQNMDKYLLKLDSLHQEVRQAINTIPQQQRVLITAHDAFGYFGKAYDIEVRGLQGISTLSEPGVRDIKELVDFIIENNIKAVFVETSVSEKAINAVIQGAKQRGYELKIGGSLYSDAMGSEGTPEGTYLGMVHANVKKITEALK